MGGGKGVRVGGKKVRTGRVVSGKGCNPQELFLVIPVFLQRGVGFGGSRV